MISNLKTPYLIACSDGVLSDLEKIYIKNVALHLGIDPEILKDFDDDEPELVLPDKQYKLYSMFHRLVIIVMIDTEADANEKRYCFNLGIRMGLHPNVVGEILEHVVQHGSFKTNPADVIGIFKKYLS